MNRFVLGLLATVVGSVTFAAPSFAMGSSDAYENMQVGVTYTVYKPGYTAGLKAQHIGGNDLCSAGTEENLLATYGRKSAKHFTITEGNPICSNIGQGSVVLKAKFNGVMLVMQAYCDPASKQKCTRSDVKRQGGHVQVHLPAAAGLRPTAVWIETFGAKNLSGAQLIRIAKGLTPVG